MASGQHVLVVDGLSETEQVLKAVLEPRGLRVNRIRSHCGGQDAGPVRPSVIVLHADDSESLPTASPLDTVPRVIIGSAELPGDADGNGHYLQHPFQYRDLIAAIERLVGSQQPG